MSPALQAATSIAVAIVVTALVTPLVRRFAVAIGAVDAPGGRHKHSRPTPRLGGVAVLLGVTASAGITGGLGSGPSAALVPILTVAGFVCCFGALDDLRGISPLGKLLGLAVAGIALFAAGAGSDAIAVPGLGRIELGWLALPITLAWILAATNAVNLIDGVDGVGPAVLAVASLGLACVAYGTGDDTAVVMLGATGGAALGFWIHNRHPASIFLGDSGSLLLGFLVASTAMATPESDSVLFVAAILALGVPFLDAGQSFLRRFRGALPEGGVLHAIRQTAVADRGHVHHRILSVTGSSERVVLSLTSATALLCLSACVLLPGGTSPAVAAAAVAVGLLVLFRLASVRAPHRAPGSTRQKELPTRWIPRRRPNRRSTDSRPALAKTKER